MDATVARARSNDIVISTELHAKPGVSADDGQSILITTGKSGCRHFL